MNRLLNWLGAGALALTISGVVPVLADESSSLTNEVSATAGTINYESAESLFVEGTLSLTDAEGAPVPDSPARNFNLAVQRPGKFHLATDDLSFISDGQRLSVQIKPESSVIYLDAPKTIDTMGICSTSPILEPIFSPMAVLDVVALDGFTKALGEGSKETLNGRDVMVHTYENGERRIAFDAASGNLVRSSMDLTGGEGQVWMHVDYLKQTATPEAKQLAFSTAVPDGYSDATKQFMAQMNPQSPSDELKGKPAPDFSLPTLDGSTVSLSGLKGKVVVMDFWATWCGPCRVALPGLQKLANELKSNPNVVFLAMNQDRAPNREALINDFTKSNNITMTQVEATGEQIARDYRIEGIPMTVIVAPDGNIAHIQTGYRPGIDEEYKRIIDGLLAGK